MEAQQLPNSARPKRNRLLGVFSTIGLSLAVALLSFAVLVPVFVHFNPDCAPSEHDGQWGLATFLSYMYALIGALAVWMATANRTLSLPCQTLIAKRK